MTAPIRRATTPLIVLALAIATIGCRAPATSSPGTPASPVAIVATLRGDPASFNRLADPASQSALVSLLLNAGLVRINRVTQQVDPWLAESWTRSDDGLRYRMRLRKGVRFSDGRPFTAADVVFSLEALYSLLGKSPVPDGLLVDGKPLKAIASGELEVEIVFPAASGPGLRLLDGLPILPKHRLEGALKAGTFAEAWGPRTPPSELAGLGPFILERFEAGQRLVFARNPFYWRTTPDGQRLPHADRVTIEIVPDQNAELLRLRAGQSDLMQSELRPEDYVSIKADADAGRLHLVQVGTATDVNVLWFNLAPGGAADPKPWLRREEFRRGVSRAVDRQQFVRAVYLGAGEPAWSPTTAGNVTWFDPTVAAPPYDPAEARRLFAQAGLRDTNGDGQLEDEHGRPARFSVLIARGRTAAEKGAAVLREALAPLGVTVDVVALDTGSMFARFGKRDYDAIYHLLEWTDTDPGANLDFWRSSGGFHLWNPAQAKPATEWERRIDDIMTRQAASLDPAERKRQFSEVQHLFAAHEPALVFAAQRIYVATAARLTGAMPALQRPQILWSADTLSVAAAAH